ncbi:MULTISPECIES: excalibur calcium-binding domain-containing protein [Mycolicibacterium]|uniref:excalibur calcium-binding domain-containing protein n=1 Tax=Mycolicibacterium TaxID=1866885 RepID=UPI00262F2517|nr:excalibur calcium-binding domain-containing protein [Mycolicibacterium fortuitum]
MAHRWAPATVTGALIAVVLAGLAGCSAPSEVDQNLEPASASTTASTSATTAVPTTTGQTSAVPPAPPNETGIAEQPMIDAEPPYPGSANQVEPPAVPYMPAPGPFSSCDAARAAGAAPLHRGFPGYSPALDRDGDGVACEAG